jgi:cysteine-rich repeat protein
MTLIRFITATYLGHQTKGAFMKKSVLIAGGFAAVLWTSAAAQAQCAGDCNGDGEVAINELITGVNIALGSAPLSACAAIDINGDGDVAINELIAAVNNALNGCPPPPGERCGDGKIDTDASGAEECDDGNNFGADGCAANCTLESTRLGEFDPDRTTATVQTEALPIPLRLTGSQKFRTGKALPNDRLLANGQTFKAGEIPVAVQAEEILFDPVRVTGLRCACVRGVPFEGFGPGNASAGSIGCNEDGLMDVNYRLIQDHNTSPDSPANRSQGAPNDAECTNTSTLPGGSISAACREGSGELCSDPEDEHIGVCRSPRILTRSGGPGGRGSGFLPFNVSISLLADAGRCVTTGAPDGCRFADYGPDCLPCTDDDLIIAPAENIPLTTGVSEAAVFDANNNQSDPRNAVIIDKDQSCFGSPCLTVNTGANFDCELLEQNQTGGLSGGSLAVTFPSIDAATIGDNVTGTVFFNK